MFVLVEAFVAVLVVNAARFGGGEGVVCFCDFDEFVMCGVIAPMNGVVSSICKHVLRLGGCRR